LALSVRVRATEPLFAAIGCGATYNLRRVTIFSRPRTLLVFTAAAVSAAMIAGCGSGSRPGVIVEGDELTVITSAPLSGDLKKAGQAMVNGERLALAEANGLAGPFTVSLTVLNSVQGEMRLPSDGQVASNARVAVLTPTSIAYIGDYDSAGTAISLPLTNQGGIAELSPLSGYAGFTGTAQAGPDEPRRFYPSGNRSFFRLAPSSVKETAAQASLQASQGCKSSFVAFSNSESGKRSAAGLALALKAESVGRAGAAATGSTPSQLRSLAQQVISSNADCLAYSGPMNVAAAELFNQLIIAEPALKFFVGRAGDSAPFTENLSARAQRATLVTTPGPDLQSLGAPGAAFTKSFRAQFGSDPGLAGLYGYAAMSDVLAAIARAGERGNDRSAVIAQLRATDRKSSVLGSYGYSAGGDSTLNAFVVSRIVGGQLVASPQLTAAIAR
jgi:branched-chain amino acid transport system substrate-binding protein